MMEYQILFELLIIACALIPGLYFFYLQVLDPWDYLKKRRKLHELGGDTWIRTEAGRMAIDDENWIIYLYKTHDEGS